MNKAECYEFLANYYNAQTATDMCNFFDTVTLAQYIMWLKEGA